MKKIKTIENIKTGFSKDGDVFETLFIDENDNKVNLIHGEEFLYLLDNKVYKYCIYKGSGNHSYDKPQEWLHQDVDKLFKGQICWLTNSENVKDNIIYWMETPIFDLWRIYYFNYSKYTVGCMYGHLPALDFEMAKDKFKEYVNSLNKFDKEDIKVLKKYNIHNVDKL